MVFIGLVLVVVVGSDEHIFCEDGGMENLVDDADTDNSVGTEIDDSGPLIDAEKMGNAPFYVCAEMFGVSYAGITIKVTKADINITIPMTMFVIVMPLVLTLSMLSVAVCAVVCAFRAKP